VDGGDVPVGGPFELGLGSDSPPSKEQNDVSWIILLQSVAGGGSIRSMTASMVLTSGMSTGSAKTIGTFRVVVLFRLHRLHNNFDGTSVPILSCSFGVAGSAIGLGDCLGPKEIIVQGWKCHGAGGW
jgi:hypothetical protein